MSFWMGFLVVAAAGTGEQAAPPPQAIRPPTVVITGKKPKKICERDSSLGSIIPTRICRTQEEWDEIHERSLAAVARMQDEQMFRQNAERHRQEGGK